MNTLLIVIIILVVLFLLFEIVRNVVGNSISKELINLLNENKLNEFNELIESKKANFFIHPYNLNFLKLSLAISNNNKAEIKKIMGIFDHVRLDRKQKEALYSRCFQYYLSINDNDEATNYYHMIKLNNPNKNHDDLDMVYDTYLNNGYKYLDTYLLKLQTASHTQRIAYESHISQMYLNKGDKENSDKYKQLAQSHLNE